MVYRLISSKNTGEQMIGMKSFDKNSLRSLAKKLIIFDSYCRELKDLRAFK